MHPTQKHRRVTVAASEAHRRKQASTNRKRSNSVPTKLPSWIDKDELPTYDEETIFDEEEISLWDSIKIDRKAVAVKNPKLVFSD